MADEPTEIPKASHRFLWVGGILTVVWLLVWVPYGYVEWCDLVGLEPNELGDFLAGMSAPLAFLWIVVGYFQQAAEFRLQVAELMAQVEASQRLAEGQHLQLNRDWLEAQPKSAAVR